MNYQPLLIAIVVVAVINLLITFVLLNRVNGMQNAEAAREKAPEARPDIPVHAVSGRTYAAAGNINGEIAAAISTALHLYKNEYHDFENTVLTINKVSKTYSPWSSKLYGLSKNPR